MDLKNKYLLNLTDSKIEKKQLDSGIYAIVKMANKELNKNYTGKYKFSVSNGNKDINELKLSPKKKREIKKLWLEFNSQLSSIQRKYENFLQKSLQDKQNNV